MVEHLSKKRWRISCLLTSLILITYFGFLWLLGYQKEWMATPLFPGCTMSILLGSLLIVFAWLLTGFYVWWCNNHYDPHVENFRQQSKKQS